jgi:3-dehydroquinate synthase
MMGAGKSAVGRAVAERTGRAFLDTDELVEARSGRSIAQIWNERGEEGFRALEWEVIAGLAGRSHLVIAVGGGAVLRAENVLALRRGGRVVWLRARAETLRARVGDGIGRPLASSLEELAASRAPLYEEAADLIVDTDELVVEELAERLARRVTVAVADRPYDVVVGRGALSELPQGRAALIMSPQVAALHGESIEKALGGDVARISIPDGEAAKSPGNVTCVWEELAQAGISREDLVVGLGGGAATDVAGFAAATYLRGVRWIAVPTSLLGMVDAAIGGKTALDLAQGKNLVGAFWQPSLVVCDTELLETLPERELRSGWGEVAKYGFIADHAIVGECALGVRVPSDHLVRRCVEIKADIVAADEREQGRRMWLNYGHTVGHAVEHASGGRLSHGEAIAVGLVAAAELGVRAGLADIREETRSVIGALGLPSRAPGLDRSSVMEAMRSDKKRTGAGPGRGLRFVLLEELGRPIIVEEAEIPPDALEKVLDGVLGER